MQCLRLWWAALALLLWAPHVHCRTVVTHEDIRDAMVSLIRMFMNSEDKLARHEQREKAVGEAMKKMLKEIDKSQKSFEPIKGIVSRLDDRLANIETIILQKEQREKETQNATNSALEAIQKSVQVLTDTINHNVKPPAAEPTYNLDARLAVTDTKIDALRTEIENLKKNLSKDNLHAICSEASDSSSLDRFTLESEKLLDKFELTMNEFVNSSRVPIDYVPLNEVSLADEAWHSKMTEVMERQEKEINKIQRLLSDAESMWKGLPRTVDLNAATNQTLTAIENVKHNITENAEQLTEKFTKKLQELSNRLVATNEDIQKSLTDGNTMTEQAFGNMSNKYDALHNDMEIISKQNGVLVQSTSKNMVEIKSWSDHRLYGLKTEIKEYIHLQNKHLNNTVSERLENIETAIITTYGDISESLSNKLETEISQVRRQIGVTFQKVSANKIILDNIQEQTQNYVNVSGSSIEDMKNKVGLITMHMSDVQSNLNFLLGKLSVSSQEFSQIKDKLSKALDDIKENFTKVKQHIDDTPGPHWITSSEVPSNN